jgi:hypothetical protein
VNAQISALLLFATLVHPLPREAKAVNGLVLRIADVSEAGLLSVEMINVSPRPIRIWAETNSWGTSHWRVLIVSEGQAKLFFQDPGNTIFTPNGPEYFEVSAGASTTRKLDLNGREWIHGTGGGARFKHGDTIIALYDVPRAMKWGEAPASLEIAKMDVWHGVCAASMEVR